MNHPMHAICDDLAAEKSDLVIVLAGLDGEQWHSPTPAAPWTVQDQVGHLAYFDEKALLAHQDPEVFLAELADPSFAETLAAHLERGAAMSPEALLSWWGDANRRLIEAYGTLDPKTRVVWYGPPMAARSKITARIMETWAHGQDIIDGLGRTRSPSPRLRHVCHIGVRARSFAFMANNLPVPREDVRVELEGPDGARWTWGAEDAVNRVTGSALGFALLVTRRRHRDDVEIAAVGNTADRWLDIAQAFAGPPGEGRRPRQFSHLDRSP